MEYRPLGRTGVQVSKLCLGTMMFGAWGNTDHDDSIRIIHAALDAGINFVDTADVYSAGESEEIVGKALKGRRDDVVLATKFFMPMGEDPNRRGGSRRWIVKAVEDSLRRLGTDWIDLYQVHRPDPDTDVDETLGALTDLVQQGKVRYIGSSSYSGSRDRRGPVDRARAAPGALPHRAAALLAARPRHRARRPARPRSATAWASSPTARSAGGWLSGQLDAPTARRPRPPASGSRRASTCRCPRTSASSKPSSSSRRSPTTPGVSLIELAIAFVVNHPAVTSAIIGPRTMEQLDSQLPAADVALDAAVLDRIDEIVPPGVNLNPADTSYGEQVLQPALRRR